MLILIFIPLYEVLFYPLLRLVGLRRPLQKLTLGGIFDGVSFVVSAIVEINLAKTYPVIPGIGEGQIRIFNGKSCDYTMTTTVPGYETISLGALKYLEAKDIKVNGPLPMAFSYFITQATPAACQGDVGFNSILYVEEETAKSIFFNGATSTRVTAQHYEDNVQKSRRGWPFIRILANIHSNSKVTLLEKGTNERYNETREHIEQVDVPDGSYEVFVGTQSILKDMELKVGGVYTLLINEKGTNDFETSLVEVTAPNSMHMLWLIPQYVIMTLGEVSQHHLVVKSTNYKSNFSSTFDNTNFNLSRSCSQSLAWNFPLHKHQKV